MFFFFQSELIDVFSSRMSDIVTVINRYYQDIYSVEQQWLVQSMQSMKVRPLIPALTFYSEFATLWLHSISLDTPVILFPRCKNICTQEECISLKRPALLITTTFVWSDTLVYCLFLRYNFM